MKRVRIATVKATGKRYVVDALHFGKGANDPDKAYLHGEVTRVTPGKGSPHTTHEGRKVFLLSEVTVAEVDKTRELAGELFRQMIDSKREEGHLMSVSRTGNTVTDYGTEATRKAVAAANKVFGEEVRASGLDKVLAKLAAGESSIIPGGKL